MIKSMTGFGRAKTEAEDRDVVIEIKSVNSRYFDCSVKLPRTYSFLEERIKGHIQKNAVSRAKVDVYVTVREHSSADTVVSLDADFAKSYINALYALRDTFSLKDDISVMSVARNTDVFSFERPEADLEDEWARFLPTLNEALATYRDARSAEGARIEADISAKLEHIKALATEVEEISASDVSSYRERLEARLRQMLRDADVVIDENRILTECVIWADKIAIDEELVRLRAHFESFREIVASPEPSGRRLDFLMQEINRETNTIGSKCNNARIARIVVEMKGELEKIREQIQNVE